MKFHKSVYGRLKIIWAPAPAPGILDPGFAGVTTIYELVNLESYHVQRSHRRDTVGIHTHRR
jgi:hypothetical protein